MVLDEPGWPDSMEPSERREPGHMSRRKMDPRSVAGAAFLSAMLLGPMAAWSTDGKTSYDDKLFRLAEILGAVHYLRELCEANEGTLWREQMRALLKSEGSTALRRAQLTRSFNNGYRSYSRTYVNCTSSARSAITGFLAEGVEITDQLVKRDE